MSKEREAQNAAEAVDPVVIDIEREVMAAFENKIKADKEESGGITLSEYVQLRDYWREASSCTAYLLAKYVVGPKVSDLPF